MVRHFCLGLKKNNIEDYSTISRSNKSRVFSKYYFRLHTPVLDLKLSSFSFCHKRIGKVFTTETCNMYCGKLLWYGKRNLLLREVLNDRLLWFPFTCNKRVFWYLQLLNYFLFPIYFEVTDFFVYEIAKCMYKCLLIEEIIFVTFCKTEKEI